MTQAGSRDDDEVDYDIDNHVVYLSVDFTPKQWLKLFGDLTYTHSEGDYDDPDFGSDVHHPSCEEGASHVMVYWDSDFDKANDWSDLGYDRLDASAGFELNFWKNFTANATFTYRDFNDEENYLGDDTDGEAYIMNVGLMWKF